MKIIIDNIPCRLLRTFRCGAPPLLEKDIIEKEKFEAIYSLDTVMRWRSSVIAEIRQSLAPGKLIVLLSGENEYMDVSKDAGAIQGRFLF